MADTFDSEPNATYDKGNEPTATTDGNNEPVAQTDNKGAPASSDPLDRQRDDRKSTSSSHSNRDTKQGRLPNKIKKPKQKNKKSKIKPTDIWNTYRPAIDYATGLKNLDIKYRMHKFLGVQVNLNDNKGWQSANKELNAYVYKQVNKRCSLVSKEETKPANFNKQAREDAISSLLHENKYDPVFEWLDGIKAEQCDDVEKLFGWLFRANIDEEITERFGIDAVAQYYADALMLIVKGIYCRTIEAGCSFPFLPVLVGGQGFGKSLFVQMLLPPAIAEEAYVDSLDMSLDQREKKIILQSAAVVECSEMAGQGRRDVAEHKAFISAKRSQVRRPYSPYPEQLERHCVMIGTTNDVECLPMDPTGDRRHIIIPIDRNDDISQTEIGTKIPEIMNANRDKLFGHAKWLVESEKQDCSYSWWKDSLRKIREELTTKAEKRTYSLEMELNNLTNPPDCEMFGNDGKLYFSSNEETEGLPIDVPSNVNRRSIMKMLNHNARNNPAIPKNLSKEYVGTTLTKMGWKSSRRRLPEPNSKVFVTYRIPPKK